MKKDFFVIFNLLFFSFFLQGQSSLNLQVPGIIPGFEDEEDEDEFSAGGKDEEDAVDEKDEEDAVDGKDEEDQFQEDKMEEDPFMKKEEKIKDDFVPDDFKDEGIKKDVFAQPIDDDFVVEKREKGKTHRYVEPDLAKITVPTYLYSESDIKSKKLFELYRNDEVVVLEETQGFMKVEFLGKEGWVPTQDVRMEKWYSYRISMEILGGVAGGGGEIKNFNVIGNYVLRLNVAILQDLVVGAEGRGLSFDSDVLYAGGGLMFRYYIHGLRTKKTRSALTVYAGYIAGQEKPELHTNIRWGETQYKVFSGPYVGGSIDYYFRTWEYLAIGIGGDFTFVKLYGETETAKLEKEFFQGGGHLSLMFNILR